MIGAGSITAIAYLLSELLGAGISISSILSEAKATGVVSDEQWAKIIAEMDDAEANWR